MRTYNTVRVDGAMLHKIISANGENETKVSKKIGYSGNYLYNAESRGRLSVVAVKALKAEGYDITPAIIIDNEPKPEQPETANVPAIIKTIEDYSYIRSNDSDRITAAIDRLTAVLQEINSKL